MNKNKKQRYEVTVYMPSLYKGMCYTDKGTFNAIDHDDLDKQVEKAFPTYTSSIVYEVKSWKNLNQNLETLKMHLIKP